MTFELMDDGSLACELCSDHDDVVKATAAIQYLPGPPPRPDKNGVTMLMDEDFGLEEGGQLIVCDKHRDELIRQGHPELDFDPVDLLKREAAVEYVQDS